MIESLGKGLVKYADTNFNFLSVSKSREQKDHLSEFFSIEKLKS